MNAHESARLYDRIVRVFLFSSAGLTLLILLFIVGFVFMHGLPVLSLSFLLDSPTDMGKEGGIFPTIIGTFLLTFAAILVAAPLGIGTAVYLTEYTKEGRLTQIIRFGIDCLAGIPSIIFGLFGFVLFVVALGFGWSIAAGALSLAFMVLPTIIRTAEEALRAVPASYRECSAALGGTKWQTIVRVVLPSALPGITTGIILAIGRAVEETAVVIFTAGLALRLPEGIFDSVRTMSVHFYVLAREGISLPNAYGTAAVLLICILLLNFLAYAIVHRFSARLR